MTKELLIKELVIEQDEGYITQEGAGAGREQDHGTIGGGSSNLNEGHTP